MNEAQLAKKIEWLETGKREADKEIRRLVKDIEKLQKSESDHKEKFKQLKNDLAKARQDSEKIKDFSLQLKEEKTENNKYRIAREGELKAETKALQSDFLQGQRKLEKEILNAREELGKITALKNRFKEQSDADIKLEARIDSIEKNISKVFSGEAARQELSLALEENRKSDDQRLSEAKGIIDSVSENMDSTSKQVHGIKLDQNKLSRGLNKLSADLKKGQETQSNFLQKVTSQQVEKERLWQDWEARFAKIEKQSNEVSQRLNEIETLDIAVKRAQETFNLLVEKINRRVNELTEIQRLGDQRFRKEWSTFQADAQKKWTSQTLSQDEIYQEAVRQRDSFSRKLSELENNFSESEERLNHLSDQSEEFLQSMLESARQLLSENEQYLNSLR